MKKIDATDLSIPALTALVAIHAAGSLSRAAVELGVTQSTLSHTLKRLRVAFDDQLFVRQGRSIVATIRCDEIVSGVDALLGQLAALAQPPRFDPKTSTSSFTVSCNFYERAVLMPGLLRLFRKQAPNARLTVIQSNIEGHDQLREGECDVLISPLVTDMAGLYRRHLLAERYACFVAPTHPLAYRPLTLAAYTAAEHVSVNYDGGWRPFYRATLDALGIEIVPRVELPSFGAIGHIIDGTDLVLTAPAALAPAFMPRAVMLEAPFDCRFEVYVFWTARNHQSAANQWLRGLVVKAARQHVKSGSAG